MAENGSRASIRLLGPVQVLDESRPVPIGGPGVRGLLALLALNVNKVVALDEIIDALWGHDPPVTARTIVHGNVSHLRRVLRTLPGQDESGARILTAPPGYRLEADPLAIDVNRARAMLERAADLPPDAAAAVLGEALALWQGPALAGVPGSVRAPELDDLRVVVHAARVDADLELGRYDELIVELSPLVRVDPLGERTAGQLMRALYHAGRRSDALTLYRLVARAARDDVGVEPGSELRWLHDRMLNDDLPARVAAEPAFGARFDAVPAQLPAAVPVLSGRQADLAWLDELLLRTDSSENPVAVVTGSAGIGKSALVIRWAHHVARQFPDGILFASLRGFDTHHPPLESAELLTQFLLGLGVPTSEVPDQVNERVALYRSLIAGRRMLVLLDDARTADQVRPLLPPSPRSMTVVTSRSRLDGLAVSNMARIRTLGTLAPEDAVRLIEEYAGPAHFDLNHALARLCGYLPLALRIAGARLAASPQWTTSDLVEELGNERTRLATLDVEDADGGDAGVSAALDASFRVLPPALAKTALELSVVPCASGGPYLAAAVCGIDVPEARRRMRVLAAHSLAMETSKDVFIAHDLVGLYLRQRSERELGAEARDEILARTIRYYQAAADRARRHLLQVVDPIDFTRTLADDAVPPFDGFDSAKAWFAAEWANLLEVLQAAHRAGLYDDVWRLARIAHTYRAVSPLLDEWTRLVDLGVTAAEASGGVLGQYWMLTARCTIAMTFRLPDGCLDAAERTLTLATGLGDKRLMTLANVQLGSALGQLGRHTEGLAKLRQAVEDTELIDDQVLRGHALNNCAEAEKRQGRYPEAIAHQLASLEIDRELGEDSYVAVSVDNLAELHRRIGELETAERYALEAVGLSVSRQFLLQEGVSRLTLGRVFLAKGVVEAAREQLTLALRIYEQAHPQLAGDVRAELLALG
ncbi:AfsR/SARP family transcriptional regulator [Amycolatopsis sp. H20-H5]|uniref:AfsR/SARP family transcriptional regulator n=1 Tax=Amycolatopsis sp. H20-H5 TaxID=3046309 RepID=UPI002DBE7B3C|nr:BTAD domain-containing putative transcriptional regulator [Amycolatopsis sp. H20-H5]MEC3982274.1 BTAD domain-containing putative transcriptional regulator [Amycolatopsis sp. H20-H5]